MRTGPADLEEAIDRLYQLPADEFTGARNALAASWKAKGDKDAAARIKALGRPTAVAWAANQLYWSDRALFDALALALTQVAAAQRRGLAGGGGPELRDAMRVRNERLQQAVRAAERRLVESGSQGGLGVQQRLAATLEALASPRPSGAGSDVVAGRLTTELPSHGFDVAFGLGAMDLPAVPKQPLGGHGGTESPHLKERKPPLVSAASAGDTPSRMTPGETEPSDPDSETPDPEPPPPRLTLVEKPDPEVRAHRQRIAEAESNVGRLRRELEIAARTLGEAESRAEAARNDLESLEARIPPTRARLQEKRAAEDAARRAHDAVRTQLAEAEATLEALDPERG